MEKCSISGTLLLVSVELRDRYFLGQIASFSTGDGCDYPCQMSMLGLFL